MWTPKREGKLILPRVWKDLAHGVGEEPLYRAKKPAKNHNPDQILPPNMYLAMAIVKGAGL